jgi:hypothetical protein
VNERASVAQGQHDRTLTSKALARSPCCFETLPLSVAPARSATELRFHRYDRLKEL